MRGQPGCYLLKPLSYPRFLQATQHLLENVNSQRATDAELPPLPAGSSPNFTFVKVDNKLVRADFADVYYVGALGNHVLPRHGPQQAHRAQRNARY